MLKSPQSHVHIRLSSFFLLVSPGVFSHRSSRPSKPRDAAPVFASSTSRSSVHMWTVLHHMVWTCKNRVPGFITPQICPRKSKCQATTSVMLQFHILATLETWCHPLTAWLICGTWIPIPILGFNPQKKTAKYIDTRFNHLFPIVSLSKHIQTAIFGHFSIPPFFGLVGQLHPHTRGPFWVPLSAQAAASACMAAWMTPADIRENCRKRPRTITKKKLLVAPNSPPATAGEKD